MLGPHVILPLSLLPPSLSFLSLSRGAIGEQGETERWRRRAMAGAAAAVAGEGRSGVGQAEGCAQPQSTITRLRGMTTTSRPMRSVAAAFVLTTSPALNHLSFPFAHHYCHSVVPRWRPARCRAKPAVEDVVDDEKEKETWRREDKPEGKDKEERRCSGAGGSWLMRLVWKSSPSPCLLCSPSPPTPSRRSSTPPSLAMSVRTLIASSLTTCNCPFILYKSTFTAQEKLYPLLDWSGE